MHNKHEDDYDIVIPNIVIAAIAVITLLFVGEPDLIDAIVSRVYVK